jgi:hypothetical protein
MNERGRERKGNEMNVINAIEVEPLRKRSSCLECTGLEGWVYEGQECKE